MAKLDARKMTIIGPLVAVTILIALFGGYILSAWLAGDV